MVSMEKNWTDMWLAYHKKGKNVMGDRVLLEFSGFRKDIGISESIRYEMELGLSKMFGAKLYTESECNEETCIANKYDKKIIIKLNNDIDAEGYAISCSDRDDTENKTYRNDAESLDTTDIIIISASDENGALYGTYAFLRLLAMGKTPEEINISQKPSCLLRMFNHWDNLDGSIERGYSGDSFFFKNNEITVSNRLRDYSRFVASCGINGVVINNVNVKDAATDLITDRYFGKLRELSNIFADYGIKLYLSINFASPMDLGGLSECDPLSQEVATWWKKKFEEIYRNLPHLGGVLVKADSEGRPGPFTYGRNQAEGANMLADAIAPFGGIVLWRCFVYNCTQDWRDKKTDRARASYDYFHELDGQFRDNVILQIKNGPMDFQIREPVSPLLGGLRNTNQMLEVQIAQEYTGHQIDLCYLMPMFREVLDFHTHCSNENDTVSDIISGKTYGNKLCGITAVINTGEDFNWTGNDLAAANLYGFGRMAYELDLSAAEIANEWVNQTFDISSEDSAKLVDMLMRSRAIYEKYTSPLGIGWMVTPGDHYGPSIDGYEYSRWGTYHRADHLGIGVDRTDKGTGYAQQYYKENADMYNDPATCPEELLLFFHHVAYDHKLKDGRTLIQYIYDSHFEGEEEAEGLAEIWKSMKGEVPEGVFERVLERFDRQILNSKEWRDQVNTYFYRKSGIPDEKGRIIY